jgi:hypothetical protein
MYVCLKLRWCFSSSLLPIITQKGTYESKHVGKQVSKRQDRKTNMFLLMQVQHLHRPPRAQHLTRAASTGRNTKLSLNQTRGLRCLRTCLTLDRFYSTTTYHRLLDMPCIFWQFISLNSHSLHKVLRQYPLFIYICTYALDWSGDGRTRTYDQYADREYNAAVAYSVCEKGAVLFPFSTKTA